MFWDELESLDLQLNSGALLSWNRMRGYFDFRDRSEPLEKVGHISGPRRMEIPIADSRAADAGSERTLRPGQHVTASHWPVTEPWAGWAV